MEQSLPNIWVPYRVTREFIIKHQEWIFVYSNDYLQRGCEGMAWFFKDEPNSYMVPTMYKYCANPVYFQDANRDEWIPKIECAIKCIPLDGRPIIPMLGIGNGCSRMREFCPIIKEFLWNELQQITYPNITWTNP
jgi:hypothetical protein